MYCLNNILERLFYRYAFFIARYYYLFIIVPVCLTLFLSSGFYFIVKQTKNDTEYAFTPIDGRAKYEKRSKTSKVILLENWCEFFRTFTEHFPIDEENFVAGQSFDVKHYVHVIVTGNGDKNQNLMRRDLLDEVVSLNNFLLNTLNVTSYDGQAVLFYRLICLQVEMACFENPHVAMLRHREELESLGNLIRYNYLVWMSTFLLVDWVTNKNAGFQSCACLTTPLFTWADFLV